MAQTSKKVNKLELLIQEVQRLAEDSGDINITEGTEQINKIKVLGKAIINDFRTVSKKYSAFNEYLKNNIEDESLAPIDAENMLYSKQREVEKTKDGKMHKMYLSLLNGGYSEFPLTKYLNIIRKSKFYKNLSDEIQEDLFQLNSAIFAESCKIISKTDMCAKTMFTKHNLHKSPSLKQRLVG
jgi:hypothetical protein